MAVFQVFQVSHCRAPLLRDAFNHKVKGTVSKMFLGGTVPSPFVPCLVGSYPQTCTFQLPTGRFNWLLESKSDGSATTIRAPQNLLKA